MILKRYLAKLKMKIINKVFIQINNYPSGMVKSIITLVFLNELILLSPGLIPKIFLLIILLSVNETSLKFLLLLDDFISCRPILPMHPVIDKFIFFIIL